MQSYTEIQFNKSVRKLFSNYMFLTEDERKIIEWLGSKGLHEDKKLKFVKNGE